MGLASAAPITSSCSWQAFCRTPTDTDKGTAAMGREHSPPTFTSPGTILLFFSWNQFQTRMQRSGPSSLLGYMGHMWSLFPAPRPATPSSTTVKCFIPQHKHVARCKHEVVPDIPLASPPSCPPRLHSDATSRKSSLTEIPQSFCPVSTPTPLQRMYQLMGLSSLTWYLTKEIQVTVVLWCLMVPGIP